MPELFPQQPKTPDEPSKPRLTKPASSDQELHSLSLLTPADKQTPEYQKMRERIDAVKAEMKRVSEDQNLTKAQRMKIISGELMAKLAKAQRFEGKEENQESFNDLIAKETESLKQFFGLNMEVPDLPEEITPERYQEWKEQGFELHYLPEIDMTQDKKYPGWQKKPDKLFEYIKNNKVAKDATRLKPGWVLIDERAKPGYDNGQQLYANDPFKEALEKLREGRIIQDYPTKDSRFNISHDELQKPEVKQALAQVLKVNPKDILLPKAMEWNYLGNAYYKEWGETNTWEWFEDEYEGGNCLNGGHSDYGGLANVDYDSAGYRNDSLGFRSLVRFS